MKRWMTWLLGCAVLAAGLGAAVWWLNLRDETPVADMAMGSPPLPAAQELIARGAYLARAGNCMTCHTTRGGAPYAGGRGIDTPFGTVFSSNLTPDERTGIGSWSAAHFWRALHNGRSKDGRLLYPAFPYPNYTQVTRADSDAIYAYLRTLPAVAQDNTAHALRWPYGTQGALAVWRALYFSPGVHQQDAGQSAQWNRGAYLVRGLGHCAACHTARNVLGATDSKLDLAGGLIPMQNWYAPSLASTAEAGVADWEPQHIVRLLQTGISPRAATIGPMAEVVLQSTQHISPEDLGAMAVYLKALPQAPPRPAQPMPDVDAKRAARGAKLYEEHCAQCHGDKGQGVPAAYPALAGNRAVTMPATANLVQIVLNGGYAPATTGNPRPFGMPPFMLKLEGSDIAMVLTHIRTAWGNQAAEVTELEVNRVRENLGR
ncbi:MAG TPA: cytochrome c [Burkholderiaceae bacterium]|nr:cytochrome c [Burkholderiaceae bacterium]